MVFRRSHVSILSDIFCSAGDGPEAVGPLHSSLGPAGRRGGGGRGGGSGPSIKRAGRAVVALPHLEAAGQPLEPDPGAAQSAEPRYWWQGILGGTGEGEHGRQSERGGHDAGEREWCALLFECI